MLTGKLSLPKDKLSRRVPFTCKGPLYCTCKVLTRSPLSIQVKSCSKLAAKHLIQRLYVIWIRLSFPPNACFFFRTGTCNKWELGDTGQQSTAQVVLKVAEESSNNKPVLPVADKGAGRVGVSE